jgi:sulfoxide reductase catalytic subunit YedY
MQSKNILKEILKEKESWNISENEVTPEEVYHGRRQFIQTGMAALAGFAVNPNFAKVETGRELTKEELATSYNNFYEFSLEKGEVKKKVDDWKLKDTDWKVEVTGLVENKKTYNLDDLMKLAGGEEERIYRFRCVEGWSMILPWEGFELNKLVKASRPKASAKYVVFQSFNDHKIGSNMGSLPFYPWPYQEGLTIEEALHPLAFIATGMYGKKLPKQNGAPLRLVVPWKYGFKNIKSIVKIEFSDKQPKTLWNELAPNEYGFYANVNPAVDHPRWSQATERVLDGKFFPTKVPTKMFNGYDKEVAGLYKGLDLKKFF